MKKRIIALALVLVMVLGLAAVAAGEAKTITVNPMTMTVNGQEVTPLKSDGTPAEVFAYDGATYVPLRYLAELLGYEVDWSAENANVAALKGEVKLPSGPKTVTGEGVGFGGAITATLTLDADGKITDVVLEGASETPAIGGAALETLADQVKAAGGADIDGVSGATFTSNGVKDAVKAALSGGAAAAVKLVPGTYTASKEGYQHCFNTVSVTVSEDAITDVRIVECGDHPVTVTEAPCREIPAAILAHQTYNVDSVTGATFTSNSIKNAVKDCLEQAGGSAGFSAAVEKAPLTQGDDVNTDVLVVGGGGAGMIAAIEAYTGGTAGETSGLSVMLIEKAGFLGGTTSLSGGVRFQYVDESGKYDDAWVESVLESEKAVLQPYMRLEFNEELIRGQARVMDKTNRLLDGVGVNSVPGPWGTSLASTDDHVDNPAGSYLTYAIHDYLPSTDIDVRLNTRGMELITDAAGAVTGVKVQDKTSTYNIYAKKVILATGGFPNNPDLIAKYAPTFVGGIPFAAGTNTGDGLIMATAIGAATVGDEMMGQMGADGINGIWPDYKIFLDYSVGRSMFVNKNGQRFCQETEKKYVTAEDLLAQEGQIAWGIVDSNNDHVDVLENSSAPYIYRADTLDELARMVGIDADGLKAEVARYNGFVKSGVDEDFGVAAADMRAVEQGPFYAFTLRAMMLDSMVGLKSDGGCRILREDGSVIPNLFGAGSVIYGGNIATYYVAAHGVGTAVYTGDLAATTATAEARTAR